MVIISARRNGKIEILRFVFCVLILLFHAEGLVPGGVKLPSIFSFFENGAIGVEFFFVVSGFFMAKSALKTPANENLGSETISFMSKKVLSVLPPHIIVFIIGFVMYGIFNVSDSVKGLSGMLMYFSKLFVDSLPSFLFLNKNGIYSKNILGEEWYLGVMFFVLFVMFPLCKKYQKTFSKIVAPVVGLMVLGYLGYTYRKQGITGVGVWDGLVYKCTLRGVAGILFGVTAYEISEKLKTMHFTKSDKVFLTLFEFGLWSGIVLYTCLDIPNKYDFLVALAIMFAVSITLSGVTAFVGLFSNNFVFYLGKISLPIYIVQAIFRYLVEEYFTGYSATFIISFYVIGSIVGGIVLYYLSMILEKAINKKLRQLKGV